MFDFEIEDPSNTKPLPDDARKVFSGSIFDVWQWDQEMYDGSKGLFERVWRHDYAYIIGVLPDGKILLQEDEQPDRGSVLTPAGGKVDEGEDIAEAAAREMLEETGYKPKEVIHWHSYRPSAKMEAVTHAFIGRDIEKVADPELEPGEKIEIKTFTFDEFVDLGMEPRLRDWMLRIKLLESKVDPAKKEDLRKILYGE
jgi:ADP-ribose pyrophosphatase